MCIYDYVTCTVGYVVLMVILPAPDPQGYMYAYNEDSVHILDYNKSCVSECRVLFHPQLTVLYMSYSTMVNVKISPMNMYAANVKMLALHTFIIS